MKRPRHLKDEAREFWDRNAPILLDDGRLTPATADGFVALCFAWADYLNARATGAPTVQVVMFSKAVNQGMAAYGMTPASRRRLKLEQPKTITETLERVMGFGAVTGAK